MVSGWTRRSPPRRGGDYASALSSERRKQAVSGCWPLARQALAEHFRVELQRLSVPEAGLRGPAGPPAPPPAPAGGAAPPAPPAPSACPTACSCHDGDVLLAVEHIGHRRPDA